MYHKSVKFRRHQRERAIARKKKIAERIYGVELYTHEGQYDKGKVHCSCPLCAYHRELDARVKLDKKIAEQEIRNFDEVPESV